VALASACAGLVVARPKTAQVEAYATQTTMLVEELKNARYF